MIDEVFEMSKFNIIQDENNYYFFRAINYADGLDIERGTTFIDGKVKRIRTDRERHEERKGVAKYNAQSEISLEEVYDHVKNRYIKETNCISLSKNANISLEYGQVHENGYVLVKVPKKDMGKTYDAGKYMLQEVEKRIYDVVHKLPQDSEILSIIKKIENSTSNESIIETIISFYEEVNKENLISKDAILARLDDKQYFSNQQQLEYNRIIGKLTILEITGELRSILPTHIDNSYLIGAIGSSLSNGELVHYGDIEEGEMYQVSSETVNVLALIQQLKERNIDSKIVEELEKKVIERALSENSEVSIRQEGQQVINDRYNRELTIEDVYTLTKGRIGYEKAQIAIEFVKKLSQSRVDVTKYTDIIIELCNGNEEILQILTNECYIVNKDIINRENGKGVNIVSSVNAGLDKNKSKFVSDNEQIKLINSVRNMTQEELQSIVNSNGLKLENEVLESILDKNEEVTENRYFAKAIVDALNFEKIYRKTAGNREISEEEREILIDKLNRANCKNIYNAFFRLGKKHDVISGYIVNLLINGYRNETLEELSNREDINEYISKNIGNLSPVVKALKLDKVLGIEDNAFAISGTGIVLRDYQKEALDNIDKIFEEKRFAGMILPTGAGKSFVAMAEMLKYKNSKIVFIAPQKTILYQFKKHIENTLGPDYFPYLTMLCYDTIGEKDEKFFENLNADLIIFDEAHRAGAPTWKPKIQKMLNKNPRAKILGMTATPERDADHKDMLYELAKMSGDYTEQEIAEKKYLAAEMDLLDAMKDDIVVSPKIVTFDYNLNSTEEYAEVKRMLDNETNPEKKAELNEIYKRMTAIIKNSKKEGINKIFNDNIKKKNGRYIIFLPRNNTNLSSEEYMKQQVEIVKGYFKDIDSSPSISYLLSNREGGDRANLEALKEFEDEKDEHSEHIKLIFAIDKLNEGVHVKGIDGAVMLRPISENSRILYKQQIGRCIFSIDPNNPVKDEDRPVIFDVYNNYLAQNMDREANRTTPTSDLYRLQAIVNWITKHKGYIPDINSDDIKEAKKAITLKNIQKKYSKYISGIDDKSLSESEKYEIQEIMRLGKSISLWDIEIPDRIILPGEKEIDRNDTFKVTGTQREFLELFKKAKELTKDKKLTGNLRLRSILDLLDILSENGLHINNRSIPLDSTLGEILENMPEEDRKEILDEIEIGLDFKIGEEYNYAKEEFYKGKALFTQYDVRNLRKFGIFSSFIDSKTKSEITSVSKSFISRGPSEFININIVTGLFYGEDGYDRHNFNREGINKTTGKVYDKNYFDQEGYYYELQEDGRYQKTDRKINDYQFDQEGYYYELQEDGRYQKTDRKINEHNFDIEGYYYEWEKYGTYRKTNRKINNYQFDIEGYYYELQADGTYQKTDKKYDKHNFDIDGYYYELQADGTYQKTDKKYDEHNFDIDGYYYKDGKKTDKKHDSHNFDQEGYYYELQKDGTYRKTARKINNNQFDQEGYYYELQADRTYRKTARKINDYQFDIDGYYYELKADGTYQKTDKKYDKCNFDIDGYYYIDGKKTNKKYDSHNFDRDGYYCDVQKDGSCKKTDRKINNNQFDRYGYYYELQADGTYRKTARKINDYQFDIDGYYYELQEDGTYQKTDKKYDSHNFDIDGYYYIDGKKTDKKYDSHNFDRNGYYCDVQKDGSCKKTDRKIDNNQFDREGYYYELQADGTYKKSARKIDNYNRDIEGSIYSLQEDGTYERLDEYGFDQEGYYYELKEDGLYKKTKSKLDRHGFDKKGFYWRKQKDGTYKNTLEKTDDNGFYINGLLRGGVIHTFDGYDVDGVNEYGFNRSGYYCVKDFRGIPKSTGLRYDPRGFMANGIHIVTGTRLDIRNFDVKGKFFRSLDYGSGKWYDFNGFGADGTYLETGEMYHDGYNAYGVDKEGKDKSGEVPPEIQFGKEYLKAVCKGNIPEVLEKYPDFDREKIDFIVYKSMEMYPKLKDVTCKYISNYMEMIKDREEKLKELNLKKSKEMSEIAKLEREIKVLRTRIRRMTPMQGFNKQ